jgi:hypothetical protein
MPSSASVPPPAGAPFPCLPPPWPLTLDRPSTAVPSRVLRCALAAIAAFHKLGSYVDPTKSDLVERCRTGYLREWRRLAAAPASLRTVVGLCRERRVVLRFRNRPGLAMRRWRDCRVPLVCEAKLACRIVSARPISVPYRTGGATSHLQGRRRRRPSRSVISVPPHSRAASATSYI